MSTNFVDVLVVGAGPVGLFCANELYRQGLQCRIVDKKSELSDKSKALAIHIRSLDLMEDCGFLPEIVAQGFKVDGIIIKSHGKQLVEAGFSKLLANHHFLIDLPQDKSERILYKGLQEKGIEVEWNTELTKIEQCPTNATATLKLADGSIEQLRANWVIACDGSHSTLRKLLYADFVGAHYNQRWWLADLLIDWDLPEDKMVAYLSDEGPLACFPMGNKRYRIVMTAPDTQSSGEPTLDDIRANFQRRSSDKATLSEAVWLSEFGIAHKQLKKFRYERIFFAGDAAHIHSPLGGQGLNTGWQDIYNLLWKLALVQKGYAKEKLLDSYQAERYPIAKSVLAKTHLMTRLVMLKNPLLIRLRNQMMHWFLSFNSIKNSIVKNLAELDLSYADSPIVAVLGKKTTFKVGEFQTDFELTALSSNETKLLRHIIQGQTHHLFLFAGLKNKQLDNLYETALTIEMRYNGLIKTHVVLIESDENSTHPYSAWLDVNQAVHKQFAIEEATVLMFRPDKYLSFTQNPLIGDELLHHLEKGYINVFPKG